MRVVRHPGLTGLGQRGLSASAAKCRSGSNRFIGSKGEILVNRGKLESTPRDLVNTKLKPGDKRLYRSDDHINNFLQCIRTRKLPISDVEIGHRSASVCNVATIALKLGPGRQLHWDPAKEEFSNNAKANALRSRPLRKPYDFI